LGRQWNKLATTAWGLWLKDAVTVLFKGAPVEKEGKTYS
jgi:hypothetical protein